MRKLFVIVCLTACAGSLLNAAPRKMNVQIREAQIRQAPAFLSRVLATVPYTEPVTVLEEKDDWFRVQPANGSIEGWMHGAALTKKRLTLSGDGPDAQLAVSSDEQALAGKGFNADVEKQFKARNAKIDFAIVDQMEQLKIPLPEVQAFLNAGKVSPMKGAER